MRRRLCARRCCICFAADMTQEMCKVVLGCVHVCRRVWALAGRSSVQFFGVEGCANSLGEFDDVNRLALEAHPEHNFQPGLWTTSE